MTWGEGSAGAADQPAHALHPPPQSSPSRLPACGPACWQQKRAPQTTGHRLRHQASSFSSLPACSFKLPALAKTG